MISNQDIKSMNYEGKKKKICQYDCLKKVLVIKTYLKVSEMKQIFSIHATNKELALRKAPIQQLVKHKQFQQLAHLF